MIRVLIVDDHPLLRYGLTRAIEGDHEITVVGEASDGSEALFMLDRVECDVIILDINMPKMNGFDALRELRFRHPNKKILVFSAYPEEEHAVPALKAGASGYFSKGGRMGDILTAIRKLGSGGKYISPTVAELLAANVCQDEPENCHNKLSDREFQVLYHLAKGKSVGDIARQLNLSVKTVSTYRTRLLDKMQMASNAEITRYAIKQGLVD